MNPALAYAPSAAATHHSLRRSAALAAVLLFILALLYRLSLFGQALYWGDLSLYFYPLEDVVRSALLRGKVPLWNPYVLCGQPLVGNPQSWVFYPSTPLLLILPVWLYFTLNSALHLAAAGTGAFLLFRRLSGDRLGALMGAFAYAGGGFIMARLQFPTMVMAAAWLPWLLVFVDRLIERPVAFHAAMFALFVALELLAGHPQLAYLSMGCTLLYALARVWQIRRHRARALRSVAGLAAGLCVGIAIGAVAILPDIQLFAASTRERLTWAQANRFVLLPEQLLNFIVPSFYGHPAQGDYWGEGNFWEPCVYLGVIPLVLACYAVLRANTRAAVRFFILVGLVSLWLSLGRFGGLYWIAFHLVPGLGSFHDPARFAYLATFGFAALSSVGMRRLRDLGMPQRFRVALVCLAALDIWAFSAHINPTLEPSLFDYRPRVLASAPARAEGRVFTALRDQVWKRYLSYSDYGPESARYAHELTNTLAPNVGMRFGVEEGSGYEPVPIKAVTEVDALVRSALERHSPELPRLLGLFNARLVLLPEGMRYRHPALREIPAEGVAAFLPRDPCPRAWLVRRTYRVDGDRRTLSALGSPAFDPRTEAIVTGSAGLGESLLANNSPTVPAQVTEDAYGALDIHADAGATAAFLVISQAWYSGWRCTVDGAKARLVRTDHAFTGVLVPPGVHRIRLWYRPQALQVGGYLSLAGLCAALAGLSYGVTSRSVSVLRRRSSVVSRV